LKVTWLNYSDFFYAHPSSDIVKVTWHDVFRLCKDSGSRMFTYSNRQDAVEIFDHIGHRFGRPNMDILVFKQSVGSIV